MTALWQVLRLVLAADPWAMARGAALSLLVLVMGAALLGLSGWFITATGLAGLAGIGIAFDVFRPSAGVRFLAMGRTAARYGERVLTHDATLRALAALRVALLRRHAHRSGRALMGLRSEAVLTRILADVDALDGVLLRLVLPSFAGLITHILALLILAWLVGWPVALTVLLAYLPAAALILWHLARRARAPSQQAEQRSQDLRQGMIDLLRDREAQIAFGGLPDRRAELLQIEEAARQAAARLDRRERAAAAGLSIVVAGASALALLAGAWLLGQGEIDPARAVIGFFVALALAETLLPLRRGFAELGRMMGAAQRIMSGKAPARAPENPVAAVPKAPVLEITRPQIACTLNPGEALALLGPSGGGKTSLLMQIAGLAPSQGIAIDGHAPEIWGEAALRLRVSMLPQRSALIAGSLRENLCLPGSQSDDALWQALKAVDLADTIAARGGLEMRLGEGGSGLSGGQSKRLCLARAILRAPKLLLLDEPTEGLDSATAQRVLTGLRAALPMTVIVAALHRDAEHSLFTQRINLRTAEKG
ncbi:MAG: ATP-binding cassette domain-containing protein [Mangrovicoccus sp.]|nr:ATP-binding cassette domain-containing protein [Mangrovicoccus sp.]